MLHLNHFYKDPYILYDLKRNHHDKSVLEEMNLLFYGYDITLCKYFVYRLLGEKNKIIKLNLNYTIIQGVEVSYYSNSNFIELNFKTHLSKERTALVEFIKEITSTRKPSNEKHIVVLNNIDALNFTLQYKLRRTIEKASGSASFIGICNVLSKVIEPLQSRFSFVRIPILTNSEKKHISLVVRNIVNTNRTPQMKYIKNIELFQDVVAYNLSFFLSEDEEAFNKDCKSFQFVDNEVKTLFTSFTKNKSINDRIPEIRQFIYMLIHYNIDHRIITQSILNSTLKIKAFAEQMISVVSILKEFDSSMIAINQCKIVHSYELCLLDILSLIHS